MRSNSVILSQMSQTVVKTARVVFTLTKSMITIPVALTCFLGTLLASPILSTHHFTITFSVWLMASASSCINQIQERHYDAQMERTKQRPLVVQAVRLWQAWALVIFLITASLTLLQNVYSLRTLALLLSALFWYNLVYTPLKQLTPFAVVPGALTGLIPPLIGYSAIAGITSFSTEIWLVALFLFIGQLPHFWLLLLLHNDDYKQAGFPVLTDHLSLIQIKRIAWVWSFAVFVFAGLLFLNGLTFTTLFRLLGLIVVVCLFALFACPKKQIRKQFLVLNLLYLFFMLTVIIDRLLHFNLQ